MVPFKQIKVMRKLIILFSLLFLSSCSEYLDKKNISKCADPKANKEGAIIAKQNGKDILLFQQDFAKDPDPLGIFEEEHLVKLGKIDLKDKISEKSGRYEKIWDDCEKEFYATPVKFKEKYK